MRWLPLLALLACAKGADPDEVDDTEDEVGFICDNEGFLPGQCPPDFTLPNHLGTPVNLRSMHGKTLLVAGSAFW